MKLVFDEKQCSEGINVIEITDDNVKLYGEYIEGEGKNYVVTGKADIDGEIYHDFKIEFELLKEPEGDNIEDILSVEWDWYDYI